MSFTGLLAQTATIRRKTAVAKTAATISFVDNGASPDQIKDSGNGLVTAGFATGMKVHVTGSTLNDGTYTIGTAAGGALTLDPGDALADETAGAAVTLTGADAYGQPESVWGDAYTDVPCRVIAGGGREISIGMQLVVADMAADFDGDVDVTEKDQVMVDEVTYGVLLVEPFRDMYGAVHHKRAQLQVVRM